MTIRSILTAVALGAAVSFASLAFAQGVATPLAEPPAPPAPPVPQLPVDQMLEFYGFWLGQRFECGALGLNDAEVVAFTRGIAIAAQGKPAPAKAETVGPSLEQFLRTRSEEVAGRRAKENKTEEDKYFAELDKNPAIKKTPSGLRYEIIAEGTGAKPTAKDTVVAHYTGTFVNGEVFDSSRSGPPAEFGLSGLIPAWSEAVPFIAPGGKIKLHVPSNLGYGEQGRGSIPPAKTLLFEIELVSVKAETPQMIPSPEIKLAP